jgi:hypothetical protein
MEDAFDLQERRLELGTSGTHPTLHRGRWKTFVATSQLDDLVGETGVLVVGNMGVGKSTAVAIQQGAVYCGNPADSYQLMEASTSVPKTSNGFTSQTLNIGVFPDSASGLVYFDTAGLDEDRGGDYACWTKFSTATCLSVLNQIQSTLVVIDTQTLLTSRGKGIRELAESIAKVVGSGENARYFYNSMAFVFTNCYIGGRKANVQEIKSRAEMALKAQTSAKNDKLADLFRNHSLSTRRMAAVVAARASAVASGSISLQDSIPIDQKIDMEKVSKDDKSYLRYCESTIELLQVMTDHPERWLVSDPNGRSACAQQRTELQAIIKQCTPINKEKLNAIVASRETASFEVAQHVTKLAHSYLPIVKRWANSLAKVTAEHDSQKETMDLIARDWKLVKDDKIDEIKRDIKLKEKSREAKEAEVNKLMVSTALKPVAKRELRKVKSSTLLSWTILGGGIAEETLTYNGKSFESPAVFKGTNFGHKAGPNENAAGGTLETTVVSTAGFDLRVDVLFNRKEKDLPDTIDRTKLLGEEMDTLEQDFKKLRRLLLIHKAIDSQERMAKHVLAGANEPKAECEEAISLLDERVQYRVAGRTEAEAESGQLTDHDALHGLVRLIKMEVLPQSEMGQGSLATIKELVQDYDKIRQNRDKAESTPALKTFLGGAHKMAENKDRFREDSPKSLPILHPAALLDSVKQLSDSCCRVTSAVSPFIEVAQHDPVSCAAALLVCFAYYGGVWSFPLLLLGVFLLVHVLQKQFERALSGFREDTKEGLGMMREELRHMTTAAGAEGVVLKEDVLRIIDRKLNSEDPHKHAMKSPLLDAMKLKFSLY